MGAYEENPSNGFAYSGETRSQWNPPMENGIGNLVDKFSGLGVNGSSKESLFQIIEAVEAAESTIKKQVEENNCLRAELQKRACELEKYKSDDSTALRSHSDVLMNEHIPGPYKEHQSVSPVGNQEESAESQHYYEYNHVNGNSKILPRGRGAVDNAGFSQFSSPSSRSISPSRYHREGEYDCKFNLSGHGLMPTSEINNQNILWKQDLVLKVREHEEEIWQLRKHLAHYSMKEAQIRNEKCVLEKRIAYMRMAFDQQQQELVDTAAKALSYRQDITEENIRLTYALQVAQQERSTFVSSLLPLLAEYSLQPSVLDAQSIVNNLKVLFKHLQEKLFVTENKNGLELVPQSYTYGQIPISSPSNAQTTMGWDPRGHHTHHTGLVGIAAQNKETGMSSPSPSRNAQDVPLRSVAHGDSHAKHFNRFSGNEMDDSDAVGNQNGREPSVQWSSGNSPYLNPSHDDPGSSFSPYLNPSRDDPGSSFSPYLPPVLEESSSSLSEAAEDDPLPAIEGLQISGEAFPGRELQASGYSINGTTSCNFEWVRYLEDGSVNYIDGAKQPNYLVTADDVDSYLAIEVQPLDNRKRMGELVNVFANENRKITCDPNVREQIEKTLFSGHASYEVSLAAGYHDGWEPAVLAIKRGGYSIKCNGPRGRVVTEKFLPDTTVLIPYGHATAFSILHSSGAEHLLRTTDSSLLRDTIVLIMRLFIIKANEKRKGKKRGLFF